MKSKKFALRALAVSKNFGDSSVLSNINLDLPVGEWLGILGESGSGKSTLLRILGRFLDQDKGDIFFKEEALPTVRGELIPGHDAIKLIHQEFELFPNQTVEENISYSLRFYDRDYRQEKVEELLQITGLKYVRNNKAKLLSGGEKQRTAIARSLAEQPDVLLLDEPFAHLDNHNRRVLSDAIESLRLQQKMSCIFVTHEASDALAWSDRIAVLRNGKIIQIGTPQNVYHEPADEYVAELTGDINWLGKGKNQFIRPEKLRRTKNPEKIKWTGFVSTMRFHGNYWEIRCRNQEGELSFYLNKNNLNVGSEVHLTYAAKDLRTIA